METSVTNWEISDRLKKLLILNKIENLETLVNLTKEDLLKLPNFGKSSLDEVIDYIYLVFKKKLKKPEKKKIQDPKICREIIEHFLGNKNVSWAKEMVAARKLLDKYKKDVILNIAPPKNIKSLSWLLGDWGDEYISKNRNDLLLIKEEKTSKIELQDESAENYLPLDGFKPKRLKDFLRKNGI